jgi:ankyrin repeat protein
MDANLSNADFCRCLVNEFGHDPCAMAEPQKQSALFSAASVGNVAACTYLLEARCSPNSADAEGFTPLFIAISTNMETDRETDRVRDTLRILVAGRADVNHRCAGKSPLHLAIQETRPRIAKALLEEFGAEVPAENHGDERPSLEELSEMARDRGLHEVRIALEKCYQRQVENARFQHELFVAATAGRATDITSLLSSASELADINVCSVNGRCALHCAAECLDDSGAAAAACCAALIEGRAEVDATDNQEQTAIFMAAQMNSASVITMLIDARASIETEDNLGNTALFAASKHDPADSTNSGASAIQVLLTNGANVNHCNQKGETALFAAVLGRPAQASPRVAALLDANCHVNAVDIEGETALFTAVREDSEALVRLLLTRGARVDVCSNSRADNASRKAANRGRTGANFKESLKGTKMLSSRKTTQFGMGMASGGITPLHCARSSAVASLLLESRASVNVQDANNRTALARAAERNDIAIVRLLAKEMRPLASDCALEAAIEAKASLGTVRTLVTKAFAKPARELAHQAQRNRQPEVADLLLRSEAAYRQHEVSKQDYTVSAEIPVDSPEYRQLLLEVMVLPLD